MTTHGDTMTTMCGTPEYVAPEILFSSTNSTKEADGYGVEVDMWSAGALLYILLSGTLAFKQSNKALLYQSIRKGNFTFTPEERWKNVSDLAKDLIKKLMEVDPKKRLTVDQALVHPWVTNNLQQNLPLGICDALQFTMSKGSLSYNVLDFEEVELETTEESDPANRTPQNNDVHSPDYLNGDKEEYEKIVEGNSLKRPLQNPEEPDTKRQKLE